MTWYCLNCGSTDLREIQPSADASGRTATAVCVTCTTPRKDRDGRLAWRRGGIPGEAGDSAAATERALARSEAGIAVGSRVMTAEPCGVCGTPICQLTEATPVPPVAAPWALIPRCMASVVPPADDEPDEDVVRSSWLPGCLSEVLCAALLVAFVVAIAWGLA